MPGLSAFAVPPSGFTTTFAVDATAPPGQWIRQVPTPVTPMGGVADCTALEYMAPPTLRTAYSIYSVSLAYAAVIQNAGLTGSYSGNILVETALLINDEVKWFGTDEQPAVNQSMGPDGFNIANGTISADLVNALRLNPRERLKLRLGIAIDTGATPPSGLAVVEGIWVAEQITPTNTLTPVQSTINYQIIDLPGNRQL